MSETTDTTKAWMRELEAVRRHMHAGGGNAGVAHPKAVHGKSGLQIMQAWLSGELPYPHIADTLDFALVQVGKGKAVFQGTPQLKHYNPLGSVHGGW